MVAHASTERVETNQTVRTNSERLVAIETLLPTLATKTDIEKLKADLTWRIIIAMGALTAIFTAVITLSNR